MSIKANVTMIEDAHVRHNEFGFNIAYHTPNKVARELILWDDRFKECDYTQLVSTVREWQRGRGL